MRRYALLVFLVLLFLLAAPTMFSLWADSDLAGRFPQEWQFVRGDANGDGQLGLSDAIFLAWVLNGDVETTCVDAMDLDDTETVGPADLIRVFQLVHFGTYTPPAPFPDCGRDTGDDRLRCEEQTQSHCPRGDWGAFPTRTTVDVDFHVASYGLIDLDGDDDLDILTLGFGVGVQRFYELLRNDGKGNFTREELTTDFEVWGLEIGDIDGDGDPDVVTRGFSLSIFDNDGAGSLELHDTLELDEFISDFALVRLDDDDSLDLVARFESIVAVYLNPWDDGFGEPQEIKVEEGNVGNDPDPSELAIGDLNGDGAPDVVVRRGGLPFAVLLNDDGQLDGPEYYESPTNNDVNIGIGDMNGNGDGDLVFVDALDEELFILPGNGDGTFDEPESVALESQLLGLVLTDFDGDGWLDMVLVDAFNPSVSLILNCKGESFEQISESQLEGIPINLEVGDLNGDGVPDVVNACGEIVTVSLGRLPE